MPNTIARRQHAVKSDSETAGPPVEIPARTEAGDAFSVLVVHIFRLNGLILAAGDALAEPAGQTSARWRVLAAVENKPETVSQIARRWGQARQSVQRVANALVQDGLAVYKENPRHQRAQLLALTSQGRIALQAIQAAQAVWANRLGEEIGEAELCQVNALLAKVLDVVRSAPSR